MSLLQMFGAAGVFLASQPHASEHRTNEWRPFQSSPLIFRPENIVTSVTTSWVDVPSRIWTLAPPPD